MRADQLRIIGLAFAIVAGWTTAHSFLGVFHDGVLYAFQAIARGGDTALTGDLFIRNGSQDDYTLFPWAHWAFITVFGLAGATKALVMLGHLLWLGGLFFVVRRLFATNAIALFVMAIVASADARYGAVGLLKFGEGMATPRVFAEAICLFALANAMNGRVVATAALIVGAMATHPLIGLAGGGLCFLVLAFQDRRLWLAAPVAVLGLFAAALAGIGPAGGLFERFDPEWLAAVRLRASYLFIDCFTLLDWSRIVAEMAVLAVAAHGAQDAARRLFCSGLVLTVLAIGLTWVSADLLENVLLTQLQPWRALWITKVVALVALGGMIAGVWASGRVRVIALLLGFTVAASGFATLADLCAGGLGVLLILAYFGGMRARAIGVVALVAALALIGLNGLFILDSFRGLAAFQQRVGADAGFTDWRFDLARPGAFLIAIVILTIPPRAVSVAAAASLALAVVSTSAWDRREAWRAYVEENAGALPLPYEFQTPEGSVYWRGRDMLPAIWFGLERPSFVSRTQGAGSVFNRETALEYQAREQLVEGFDEDASANVMTFRGPAPRDPTVLEIAAVCRHREAPELIILRRPLPGVAATIWRAPTPTVSAYLDPSTGKGLDGFQVRRTREHVLHTCGDVLAAASGD